MCFTLSHLYVIIFMLILYIFFFFFSSRRRHTRCLSDWSSDVCSSDLGPGFDVDEHQPYRPGDDVRRIDWNVTARMNAPYVRHTHAEREMNVMIAVDVSRSMELGSAAHSKKEVMTFITASLLFSAVADQ